MKTELATVEDLSGLPLEELSEMANMFGERCQQAAKKTVQDAVASGTALLAAKRKCPHGTWIKWLSANWRYSRVTAMTYMQLASNVKRFTFDDVGSIREAIGLIAFESTDGQCGDDGSPPAREHRIPDRVEVIDHIVDTNKKVDASTVDDDPTPDPPTIRKTAKGSEKVSEADKPRTQPIVPEVMADDEMQIAKVDPVAEWFDSHSLSEIVGRIVEKIEDDKARKAAAKQLRKLADQLDPPDETSAIPKAAELKSHIPDELPDAIDAALWQFVKLKQFYKDRKWRYQSVDQFAGDMKRLKNKLKAYGEAKVERMLLDAFDKGWRHWDHDLQNGKVNGNGHTESLADRVASKAAKLKDIFG